MSIASPRPSGRSTSTSRRPAGSPRNHGLLRRLGTALAAGSMALAVTAPTALAQDLAITTPYPAIVVAPGATVSFSVDISTSSPQRVELELTGAPDSWGAELHGGGFVVDAVETTGDEPTSIRVDMTVPTDASGTTSMTLAGQIGSETVELLLEVRVDAEATGAISIRNDIPALRGPSTQTFSFSLTVVNDTTEDQSYSATGAGPTGWTVNTTLTGQSQAASAIVNAGSTAGVTVAVEPPLDVDAGTYQIQVATSIGGQTLVNDLQVEITGSYELSVTTQSGALNGRGASGSASPIIVLVTNGGTGAVTNVQMTSSAPNDWEITFDRDTIETIAAGATETVTAQVRASGDAIAGDYNISITAAGEPSARDTMEIRYTVETSLLWGVIGAALIVAVAAGVWWVFQRYGRR